MNTLDKLIDKLFNYSIIKKLHKLYGFKWIFMQLIRYRLWRLEQHVFFILKYGDVRQIQYVGNYFIEAGKKSNIPKYVECGKLINEKAEQIILRRIGL